MTENFLIFDLETIPVDWESLSESQQEYLLRRAETDEEIEQKKNEMALSPMTAQIVCIGLQRVKKDADGEYVTESTAAFSVKDGLEDDKVVESVTMADGNICYLSTEKTAIETFWAILKKYKDIHLVSFNGRNFDAPFLMLRSAIHKIKPYRNIMAGTKFNYPYHTDLIDELTYFNPSQYGATRRYNFDFYTRAFGITSPKAAGVDGSKVSQYFKEGRIEEISEYCLRDVKATWELYKYWREYLMF